MLSTFANTILTETIIQNSELKYIFSSIITIFNTKWQDKGPGRYS